MQDNVNTAEAAQLAEQLAWVQIINDGTITQSTTDNYPVDTEGTVPGSVVDESEITEVSTDAFPTDPPTLPSWPHII
jgi:hypothetical protein